MLISEYTGGGFGSRIPGNIAMAIPALLSKKANAPVMMRITREEDHYIGRARPALHARAKVGFDKEGRITALDLFALVENGPYDAVGDARSAADVISLAYQPKAMRARMLNVLTNTPPRGPQRAPGGMQGIAIMEPIISQAARKLGVDQVAIRKINAPAGKAKFGAPAARGQQLYVTSAFVKEALDKGAELFNWEEKKARSGQRIGSKVRGSGVGISTYAAGSIGFDGLLVIRPDGKVQLQSGIGNLGTHAVIDVHRVAAEILGVAWEQCEVVWGNTSKNLPWTCASGGSQTLHAMTRAAHAVGTQAKKMLQDIAARTLGGSPASYQVADGRVFGGGRSMTLAQAAQKAIELGGKYDGHEPPENVNNYTKTSMKALAGQGLVAAARDTYPRDGQSRSYVVGFAEVEVDVETGHFAILDFAAVADVGTVINPRSLQGQTFGGVMLGHRPCDRPEVGVRPALRRAAGQALPLQQAAVNSRRAGQFPVCGREPAGSGDPGRRAWHRRAAGRRRLRGRAERHCGGGGRRRVPAHAGDGGHDSDGARARAPDARTVDGKHLSDLVIGSLGQ